MRLTADEYERGLLSWDATTPPGTAILPETISWAEAPPAGFPDGLTWNGPYTNPNGSIVQSAALQHRQLRVGLKTSDPTKTPILRQIRWETPDGVQLGVESGRAPHFVRVARRPGFACRIAVRPRAGSWAIPQVILDMANELRVRFVQGRIRGTSLRPFDHYEIEEGKAILQGGQSEVVELDGTFLEVHATVDQPGLTFEDGTELARANCLAALGLIALVCGEQVLGDIVLEDSVETSADGENGADKIPVTAVFPNVVGEQQFELVDKSLQWASSSGGDGNRTARGVHLALRWYLKALLADTPFDRFTSCFLGLETLATSYAVDFPPSTRRPEAEKFDDLVAAARASGFEADSQMVNAVKSLLNDFPLAAKFARLRQALDSSLGDAKSDLETFDAGRAARNRVLHGEQVEIPHDMASRVRDLLERLIGSLIGTDRAERFPTPYFVKLDFAWAPPSST